jgi:hypothetical protein
VSLVFNQTITRRRAPSSTNSRGEVVRSWDSAVDAPLSGWALDAGDTSEVNDGRDGIVRVWTARCRSLTVDLVDSDRVVVFGVEYLIDGAVLRQPGPSSMTSHTILRLVHVDG